MGNRKEEKEAKLMVQCKKCGKCCRQYYLNYSPEMIREKLEKITDPVFKLEVEFILAMSVLVGKVDASPQIWEYKCKYIGDDNLCMMEEVKPPICKDFPYIGIHNNVGLAEGCVYWELRKQKEAVDEVSNQDQQKEYKEESKCRKA